MQSIISLSEGQYHSPSGEYNRGAHPYGVRLPGRCIFYSRLFPDRLRQDRRNFISRPPLGRGAEHFDILPALQPPGVAIGVIVAILSTIAFFGFILWLFTL